MLVFEERGKPEYPEKNHSEQRREPTTNSTHIWRQRRELNPGPHWWEASALNTAPPLLPTLADSSGVSLSLDHTHIGLPYWFNLNFPTSIPATFIWESLPGCIIRFKNFRFRLEFSNLIVHSCSFFERLQNLWYRWTRSCTKIFRFGVILVLKIGRKV